MAEYHGNDPVKPLNRAAKFSITSDAPQKISQALYYELMVAHESVTEKQLANWSDRVYKDLEQHFGDYIDFHAAANPKRLHHVYDWNGVGDPRARLWRLKKVTSKGGTFKVTYAFNQSRRKAPIDPVLKVPGPNGKVVKKTYVFKMKAYVMEYGIPVTVRPKTGRYLAFRAENMPRNIGFSAGPRRVNYPGGLPTKFAFARSFSGFFRSGLATKYLKPSLERPVKVMRRAGSKIPVSIRSSTFKGGISQSQVQQMARFRVEQESRGVY
jgi:hypothetical protein